jgi:hypothetical protein
MLIWQLFAERFQNETISSSKQWKVSGNAWETSLHLCNSGKTGHLSEKNSKREENHKFGKSLES